MLGGERLCRKPDNKTKSRLARYKQNLRFINPSCCPAIIQSKPICPRHPGLLHKGSHQTAGGCQLHGNLTPPRISPSCPHCVWLWLDRSITPSPVMATPGADPALITDCFSLPAGTADRGAAANVAYAHRNSNGKVPDEWVCGFQRANPFTRIKRRTGERLFVASHLFPHL